MKTLFWSLMLVAGIAQAQEPTTSTLTDVCKKDCPQAKTDEEAHKCAERKGRLNKDFRKSKCWEVNEEYEKKSGSEAKH